MEKIEKGQWYELVADFIEENLEDFYSRFYKEFELVKTGKGFRLEPCPMCSHRDCCAVGVAVHCFSCKWSGTHINAWTHYATNALGITMQEALKALEDYSGVPFPKTSSEEIVKYQKNQRQQQILKFAESFYHNQLLELKQVFDYDTQKLTPLEYLKNERSRTLETIMALKIGFSANYLELRQSLMAGGFSSEEIKEAKAWIPEGLFAFFYKDPSTKEIIRINTKNPFKMRYKSFEADGKEKLGDVIQGYSVGEKTLMYSPGFSFKKPFAVVEGEHDLASLLENGCDNVCCLGGNIPAGLLGYNLGRAEDKIFIFMDNDHKGEEYVDMANKELPHKDLYRVKYSTLWKDPDEYYTKSSENLKWDDLAKTAFQIETESFKITHQGPVWSAANRHKRLDYVITGKDRKGNIIGKAMMYVDGKMVLREDDIQLSKCKRKMSELSYVIIDAMEDYHNNNFEDKSNETLLSIYDNSTKKDVIISTIAKRIYSLKNPEDIEKMASDVRVCVDRIKLDSSVFDAILKEMNGLGNKDVTKMGYPRMRICQHFSAAENDAYFYYTVIKREGDVTRRLPYLLRNDRRSIRLDILKRKDAQCLILVDNKYELPEEVKTAVFTLQSCSLTQGMVEKYVSGQIPPEDICPNKLANELTSYIKQFYYTAVEDVYKVLSLFCFATYYYTLFPEMPYFHIHGQKGSGKTVLDATLEMFCFNASRTISFTDAALFRKTAIEGGTLILDETENMTTRAKGQESDRAAILKGGYSKSNFVMRYNLDKGVVEEFEVYSPKVLSNIFGLEDILGDRCIPISTKRCDKGNGKKLKSPTSYYSENMEEVKELTGRLCFCALESFQTVHALFTNKDNMFDTDTPRLTQILSPLLAIAKHVDIPEKEKLLKEYPDLDPKTLVGQYETALCNYYENHVKKIKEEIENSTPEGTITEIVKSVAMELSGEIPITERYYTSPEIHKYKGDIKFNLEEGWFELDAIHLKVFFEENHPGDTMFVRQVPGYIKRVFNFNCCYRRKQVTFENEDLIKELKNTRSKVAAYRFEFKKVLKADRLADKISASEILDMMPKSTKF